MTMSAPTATAVGGAVAALPTGPLGRVVAVSMATGVVAAAVLTFAVLPGPSEAPTVAAAPIASATGWPMLACLSTRLTTGPQRWAYVPAAVMAAAGAALVA